MPLKIGTIEERHSEPQDQRLSSVGPDFFFEKPVHLGHRHWPSFSLVVFCGLRLAFGLALLARDYHVRSFSSPGRMMRLLNHLDLRRFGKTARVMVGGADFFYY